MIDTKALAPSTRAGGRWSNFSISGKLMSTCGRPLARRFAIRSGQAVQGLRTEHEVDVRRALDDRRAFLTGDAAADADQQTRVFLLQVLDAPEIVKHLLLRLLAHRAGVEQDHVGLLRPVGRRQSLGLTQYVGHLVRVVLVHLATKGLYGLNTYLPIPTSPSRGGFIVALTASGGIARSCAETEGESPISATRSRVEVRIGDRARKDCSALNCSLALDVSPSRAGDLTSHYILQRNEPFLALALYYEEC
jgi:hypothetical protein